MALSFHGQRGVCVNVAPSFTIKYSCHTEFIAEDHHGVCFHVMVHIVMSVGYCIVYLSHSTLFGL